MIHSSSSDGSSPGQTSSTNDDETDDLEHVDLVQQMERLSMYNSPRFFGSSSMFAMANNVLRMKTAILGDEPAPERGPPQFWYLQPVRCPFVFLERSFLTPYSVGTRDGRPSDSTIHISAT